MRGRREICCRGRWRSDGGYAVPDESAHYLVEFRNFVWWSFDDDGLALGEDSCTTISLDSWQLVSDAELPGVYLDYLDRIGRDERPCGSAPPPTTDRGPSSRGGR